MKRVRHLPWIAVAISALGLGSALTISASGTSTPAPTRAAPTTIATVDLQVLFDGLDELKNMRQALQTRISELEQEPQQILEQMKRINEELDLQELSDKEQLDRRVRLAVLNEEHKAKVQAARLLVQIEDGRMTREMYEKGLGAISLIAQEEGYDLVLLEDQAIPVPDGPTATSRDVQGAILARQILYASESIDVTQQVVQRLNNDYKAGR